MSLSRRFSDNRNLYRARDLRNIVFIDFRIPNCDTLLQQIVPEARVIALGSRSNGVLDLTQILNRSCCQEVHLMCLGSPGCLYLGNSELSLNTLIQYESELQSWFACQRLIRLNSAEPPQGYCDRLGLTVGQNSQRFDPPQLSIYGCNVAAGDGGAEFIAKLGSITGAKITASVNLVNSNALGYNSL